MPPRAKQPKTESFKGTANHNGKPDLNGKQPDYVTNLQTLFGMIAQVDDSFLDDAREELSGRMRPKFCDSYETLVASWKRAMKWIPELDISLSVMLASVVSTSSQGDQLWIKLMGPASCGKTTLSEGVSVARKHVIPKDTFTGLSSGYQVDEDGSENLSFVKQLANRTLIINDGDTVMQSPNLREILSQLRAYYGGNLRTQYKNKMSHDTEGENTTVIFCGTSSLKALDESELGERFLDCVVMDTINDDLEMDILMLVGERAFRETGVRSVGASGRQSKEKTEAMELTGGYVEYLRENDEALLAGVSWSKEDHTKIAHLARYVAHMRARPSKRMEEEDAERELAARVMVQLCRLAKCLAAVLNKHSIDREVMYRVRKVAMDTAVGISTEIVSHLYEAGASGVALKSLGLLMSHKEEKIRGMLNFLSNSKIGVVEKFAPSQGGVRKGTRYRLSPKGERMYQNVMSNQRPLRTS